MTTPCSADPPLGLHVLPGLAALGEAAGRVLDAPHGLGLTRAWLEATEAAGLPDGSHPHLLLFTRAGRPLALLPMLLGGVGLQGMTSPYTCDFGLLAAPGVTVSDVRAIGYALGRHCAAWPTVRLDALPDGAWWTAPLLAGARAAGLAAVRFAHFGNWHAPVAELDWPAYLARRPGRLREVVRRKLPRAARHTVTEVLSASADAERGVAAFEDVLRRSWKPAEPFPRFNAAIIRHAAAAGILRLGVMRGPDGPIAVQIWTVLDGVATVLKLVHDEAHAALSPGTLLTARVISHILAEGGVRELDFGRGDDGYKALWCDKRRQRIGLVLANPRRPAGAAFLLRHWAGRVLRTVQSSRPHRTGEGESVHAYPV